MYKRYTKVNGSKPVIPEMLRVAGYARVSSGKDAMLHSLSSQVSYFSNLIQNHPGWQYVGVYADEALTGTKSDRAEFQRLLADCRAGKIDLVLVKAVSRLARNTITLLETVRELKALGVDIFFENENIHTLSAEGELMLTLIAAVAQEQSRSVSDNCRWRIWSSFSEGKTWPVKPYGYCIIGGDYVVIDHESEVVREIFADYLAGMGINAITRKLNDRGTPFGIEPGWNESTVHKMLRNERYVGDMLLQKTFVCDHLTKQKRVNRGERPSVYVDEHHDPIIDRETFDKVQHRLIERSRLYASEHKGHNCYPFTGLLRCATCGKPYRRKINAAGTKYAKPVWICRIYNQLGRKYCPSKQIPEDILFNVTARLLGVDEVGKAIVKERIQCIDVHNGNKLTFHFHDGRSVEHTWQDHSRSDSWDETARARASEQTKARYAQ